MTPKASATAVIEQVCL